MTKPSESNRTPSEGRFDIPLLYRTCHELRNPLNGLLGTVQLLLDSSLNHEQRSYALDIHRSATAVLELLNDLLDLAKIDSDRLELVEGPFDVGETVADVLAQQAPRAVRTGLELISYLSPDVPKIAIGDSLRFRQILTNLLGNALRFTERGDICLRLTVDSRTEGRALLHGQIADTGVGIAPQAQRTIFEPFVQAAGSPMRGGTGLGLSIVAQLVERMGGRCWVESAPGEGSTFHFTVQAKLPEAAPPPIAVQVPPDLRALPVLFVDPNPRYRKVFSDLLDDWGLQPTALRDGAAALAALESAVERNRPFRLILTEASAPDYDGFEFVREVRARPALAATPIVLVSWIRRAADLERSRDLGVSEFVLKPIRQERFLETLVAAIRGRAARQVEPCRLPPLGSRKVLVVDDESLSRKTTQRLLQRRRHEVAAAASGSEALRMLGEARFDAVILDLWMADMSGFELAGRIRERLASPDRPRLIALSGDIRPEIAEQCRISGMETFLAKPFEPDDLFRAVEGDS